MNRKRLFRPYREERLTVRGLGGRMWALGTRARWRCRAEPAADCVGDLELAADIHRLADVQ